MKRHDASPNEPPIADGRVAATLDLRVYRLAAIQKAAYRLADRCTVALGTADGDILPLSFLFRAGTTEAAAREAVRLFFQEVLDEELRAQIRAETAPIRSLILAHAFSKTDLIQRS